MTTINREFNHRTHGKIGAVELTMPDGADTGWTLDGESLPPASVAYLVHFGLQCLQDAYAGAESAMDAKTRWTDKRKRLADGTADVRANSGVDDVTKVMRSLARADWIATLPKDKRKDARGIPAGELAAHMDAIISNDAEAYRTRAEAEIERRNAEAKARAEAIAKAQSAVAKAKIDLDALLKA